MLTDGSEMSRRHEEIPAIRVDRYPFLSPAQVNADLSDHEECHESTQPNVVGEWWKSAVPAYRE